MSARGNVAAMDITELTNAVEQISRGYAAAFGIVRDDNWFVLKLQEEVGELTQAHLMQDQGPEQGRTRHCFQTGGR